jgi:hypothetical protein
MQDISVISLDLNGRDLSKLTASHRPLLAAPADNLPLAASVEVLAEIVCRSGHQPFAFRIPDDARLLAVWMQAGTAAIVTTYWRHQLAHVDLVLAASGPDLQGVAQTVALTEEELDLFRQRPCPLLARCRVRRRVPSIAEVLGMIAYLPAMLDAATAAD